MTKLETLMSDFHAHVSYIFDEHGEVAPSWMLEDAAGKQLVVLSPFTDETASKEAIVEAVRGLLTEHNAVRYCFASEIWCDPTQTKDAVIILGEERDSGERCGMIYDIDRSRRRPRLMGGQEFTAVEGRFTGLFRRRGH
jgi:hypothetical protein